MAEACKSCSGNSFGYIDENHVYVDNGEPCPDCTSRFAAYARSAGANIVDGLKTKRAPESLVYGPHIEPPRARTETITVVDGGTPSTDGGTDARGAGFTDEQIQ